MNVETKLKELEAMADRLETALSAKDAATQQLKSENLKLKTEVEVLRDIIYRNSKDRAITTASTPQRTDTSDYEYGRELARSYAGRIRSDE